MIKFEDNRFFKQEFLQKQKDSYVRDLILEVKEVESIEEIIYRLERITNTITVSLAKELWNEYVVSIDKPEGVIGGTEQKPEVEPKSESKMSEKKYVSHIRQDHNTGFKLAKGEASKQLRCASKMPPLKNKIGDESERFDITKSEVSKWLMQQPEIMQYIFTRIKNSGFIVYNSDTKCWCGSDYSQSENSSINGMTIDEIYQQCVTNGKVTIDLMAEYMGLNRNDTKKAIRINGNYWIDDNEIGKKRR